ncbi:MAG: hypothetical protein HC793_02555 [Aquincola sp.]|nr:hypothetical protein [Aquincola sp.]
MAARVCLHLLHSAGRRQTLGLRLNQSDRDGLFAAGDLDAERVIRAALAAPPGRPVDDFDGPGRFLTPDPYVAQPLSAQAYNRYSYVSNDPANAVDPTGKLTQTTCTVTGPQDIHCIAWGSTVIDESIHAPFWAGSVLDPSSRALHGERPLADRPRMAPGPRLRF